MYYRLKYMFLKETITKIFLKIPYDSNLSSPLSLFTMNITLHNLTLCPCQYLPHQCISMLSSIISKRTKAKRNDFSHYISVFTVYHRKKKFELLIDLAWNCLFFSSFSLMHFLLPLQNIYINCYSTVSKYYF